MLRRLVERVKRAVLTCGDSAAGGEGISLVSLLAAADRVVVDDLALGEGPAGARAGVAALLVDAGQVARALTMYHTLRPAVGRHPNIAWWQHINIDNQEGELENYLRCFRIQYCITQKSSTDSKKTSPIRSPSYRCLCLGSWQTGAGGDPAHVAALGVAAARVRLAGVRRSRGSRNYH